MSLKSNLITLTAVALLATTINNAAYAQRGFNKSGGNRASSSRSSAMKSSRPSSSFGKSSSMSGRTMSTGSRNSSSFATRGVSSTTSRNTYNSNRGVQQKSSSGNVSRLVPNSTPRRTPGVPSSGSRLTKNLMPTTKSPITRSPIGKAPNTKTTTTSRPAGSLAKGISLTRPKAATGTGITQRLPGTGTGTGIGTGKGASTRQPTRPTSPMIKGRIPTTPSGTVRNPIQSGDPDAGNPVAPNPLATAGPAQGIVAGDRPPVIDSPFEPPIQPGRGESNGSGTQGNPPVPAGELPLPGQQYEVGDVIAANGDVVAEEFLDLIADGEFLYTDSIAPWDDPYDPFWDQGPPNGWKGYWPDFDPPADTPDPGNTPNPGNEPDPGYNPNPGNEPNPGHNPNPGHDPVPPPYGDPHCDDQPGCPDRGGCGPVIIIDPYFPPVTPCPPCVVDVCRPVGCPTVIAPPIVDAGFPVTAPLEDGNVPVEEVAEEAEPAAPALQLIVASDNTLEAAGLGEIAGTAGLEVNGIGVPLTIVQWTNERLVMTVPNLGLAQPTEAVLFLFDSEGQAMAQVPVELLTQSMADQLALNP